MNDSATFLDKQTITIHIAQRSEMYVITSFESENECKKTEQVPIPLPRASRNFPDAKSRNEKKFDNLISDPDGQDRKVKLFGRKMLTFYSYPTLL